MEHAKKLALVDPANLDVGNVRRHYGALDRNISDVLNRDDVDEREKLRLYQSALNKFLINKRTVQDDLNAPLKVSGTGDAQLQQLLSQLLARSVAEASQAVAAVDAPTPTVAPAVLSAETTPPLPTTPASTRRRPRRSPSSPPPPRRRVQPTRKTTEWLRYGGVKP